MLLISKMVEGGGLQRMEERTEKRKERGGEVGYIPGVDTLILEVKSLV